MVETKLIQGLYQKYFMDTFETNPYVKKLDTDHKGFSNIPEITTHCAADLQK